MIGKRIRDHLSRYLQKLKQNNKKAVKVCCANHCISPDRYKCVAIDI